MACGPCEKRRQMIADARKHAGGKGVAKVLPKVARDFVKNPPSIRGKRNG